MKNNFWKGKRVLITGHEGFLGSNMTKTLAGYGAIVTGIDPKTHRKNTLFSKNDYRSFKTIRGSVANYKLVFKLLKKNRIEYVFHIGAEAIVGECNKNPMKCFNANIEGTWKLLEACRQYGKIKAIVIASSDKAYGSHKVLPYKETASLHGDHPYDVSKSCTDLIAYTYFHTYNLPVAVTRCGNIYGPGDFNFSRIVPDAIRCAITGKTLKIRSDGRFTRDYVYVDDIVNGYVMLAEQLEKKRLAGEAFNFSDENPITVLDFVNEIYKAMEKKPGYKVFNIAKYEIRHQYLASGKARRLLGWKPQYSLKSGIEAALNWYMSYFDKEGGAVSL
ncbi:MAG: GDP-mannose 4,6-dehydratase [Candidatus Omnitrophota bacterium]